MKKTIVIGVVLTAGTMALLAASQKPAHSGGGSVPRGKYLVTILGCGDCHTPKKMGPNGPEPDDTRMLAGYVEEKLPPAPAPSGPWIVSMTGQLTAFAGPWGISYAKNLTPDEITGIGTWSEETFAKALRTGKHMGVSRPILPPMPWNWYANMTDSDLKAVYAYLRTIPPIRNPQPEPAPPTGAPGKKP
jgi:mono/diheme cytochrome c family protein